MMKPKWETTAPCEAEMTEDEKKEARFLARVATDPSVNAGQVIEAFGPQFTSLGLNAVVECLSQSIRRVEANDMRPSEAMLFAQAVALQSIFTGMAQLASRHKGQRLDEAERCMRMALKAQNQCRMTLETLAALKNPRVVVAQQTNIANGPQQVNNGPAVPGDPVVRTLARTATRFSKTNYWRCSMANGWTPERRARQAERIKQWQPWDRSTGPKTTEGKARSSRNAWKGGVREQLQTLCRVLREHARSLRELLGG